MSPRTKDPIVVLCCVALLALLPSGCSPYAGDGLNEEAQGEYETQIATKTQCKKLAACDLQTPCKDVKHTCVALKSCGKTACVDLATACKLECGAKGCNGMAMSYPAQLICNAPAPKPDCSKLATCGVYTQCKKPGEQCLILKSCKKAVCIDPALACKMECGTAGCNGMAMSYPGQLFCKSSGGGSTPGGGGGSTPGGSTPGGAGGSTP